MEDNVRFRDSTLERVKIGGDGRIWETVPCGVYAIIKLRPDLADMYECMLHINTFILEKKRKPNPNLLELKFFK